MKPLLYLRTSTKDQNPELQREQGIKFCIDLGLESPEVFSEQGSAYKLEKVRPIWENVIEIAKKEKRAIVVWRYDRAFRNGKEFYKFMKVMFEVYKIKVYSVTEPSILSFWKILDTANTGNPIFDELFSGILKLLWDFQIKQKGEEAEEESKKKSDRVILAVRKVDGVTKSYKGNKWGRKSIPKQTIKKILELKEQGLSSREIAKNEDVFYWDKNNNKRQVGKSTVHKIIAENKGEKS